MYAVDSAGGRAGYAQFTLVDVTRQSDIRIGTLLTLLVGRAPAAHVRNLFAVSYGPEEYKAAPAPSEHHSTLAREPRPLPIRGGASS